MRCVISIPKKRGRISLRIHIYYGGRGLIEDSTIYVMNKITEVLQELRVEVVRFNLFEQKNGIAMLPNTLKEADGIILAVNVEWIGIGGYMQQFLDSCWLYGDKEKISGMYMFPVVIANTFGEKEAQQTLIKSWEVLGGIACEGICTYVESPAEFETNSNYGKIIERKAENLYRTINQKAVSLPSSNNAMINKVQQVSTLKLTPQESEQLSMYVSDDSYVKKQKEDIEELALLFKGMLNQGSDDSKNLYIQSLKDNYIPQGVDFNASFAIEISDIKKNLIIEVDNNKLNCYYGEKIDAQVTAKTSSEVMNKLVNGRTTFQGAFMSGELSAKGNFKTLRTFDQLFQFNVLSK